VDWDVLAPTTMAENDAAWRALRSTCPVAWTPRNGGHWVVSGYEQVAEAFRGWEQFSSARTDPAVSSITLGNAQIPRLVPEEMDPPEWHPVRRVLARQLSPAASERLRPRARHWASHCLDAAMESGRCELVTEFAFPVPAAVALEWLGFPSSDWEMMSHAFHDPLAHPRGSSEQARAGKAFLTVMGRVRDEIAARTVRPRDDGMTSILHSDVEGQPVSTELAEALVFMTIGGGVDTTSALASAALLHLHRQPDDRARLLEDRTLLESATEEFLRLYPPARTHARTVTGDIEFGGCPMRAGDRVLLSETSAGRDPLAFDDPDRFVIDRFPNRHLAFGAGIHRCPGSHLARIVFTEMLDELLDRIPDYRIVDEEVVEYPNWASIGGWAKLPAVFPPRPRGS